MASPAAGATDLDLRLRVGLGDDVSKRPQRARSSPRRRLLPCGYWLGLGMFISGHLSVSDAQLAGGFTPPPKMSQTAVMSVFVAVAQSASPLTAGMKAATSSLMQAEYSATVAVQVEGMSLQPGLVVEPALRQEVSVLVQFDCNLASVGGLLDAA